MRTMLWTVFLIVAVQTMAVASTAVASPSTVTATVPVSAPEGTTRPNGQDDKAQAAARRNQEEQPARVQSQVLSKNFASPKPVQIYWFFGAR